MTTFEPVPETVTGWRGMGDGFGDANATGEAVVLVVLAPVVGLGLLDDAAAPPQIAPTIRQTTPTAIVRPHPPEDLTGAVGIVGG